MKFVAVVALLTLLLISVDANALATQASCYGDCQQLLRDITGNNSLIGLTYLLAPVAGLVLFIELRQPDSKRRKQTQHTGMARVFWWLAGLAFVVMVLAGLSR